MPIATHIIGQNFIHKLISHAPEIFNFNFDSQFTVYLSRSGELNRGHVWLPLMLERIVGKLCTHKHVLYLKFCSTLILITIDKARTAMKLCLEQLLSFSNICLLFVLHLKLLSD